jgi:hypothetical protein
MVLIMVNNTSPTFYALARVILVWLRLKPVSPFASLDHILFPMNG